MARISLYLMKNAERSQQAVEGIPLPLPANIYKQLKANKLQVALKHTFMSTCDGQGVMRAFGVRLITQEYTNKYPHASKYKYAVYRAYIAVHSGTLRFGRGQYFAHNETAQLLQMLDTLFMKMNPYSKQEYASVITIPDTFYLNWMHKIKSNGIPHMMEEIQRLFEMLDLLPPLLEYVEVQKSYDHHIASCSNGAYDHIRWPEVLLEQPFHLWAINPGDLIELKMTHPPRTNQYMNTQVWEQHIVPPPPDQGTTEFVNLVAERFDHCYPLRISFQRMWKHQCMYYLHMNQQDMANACHHTSVMLGDAKYKVKNMPAMMAIIERSVYRCVPRLFPCDLSLYLFDRYGLNATLNVLIEGAADVIPYRMIPPLGTFEAFSQMLTRLIELQRNDESYKKVSFDQRFMTAMLQQLIVQVGDRLNYVEALKIILNDAFQSLFEMLSVVWSKLNDSNSGFKNDEEIRLSRYVIWPMFNKQMEKSNNKWDWKGPVNVFVKKDMCSHCDKLGDMMRCSACQNVLYCSKECQVDDWKFHKGACKK
ncbi:hypothetical protein AKO1_006336 [Acrasis kona]|uniref:MYND-type domain-containing protein n=1 Tax=Acrasis kona TaxID=1008807 RepID=A0AAW2YGG8_9EUKA